MARPSLGGSPAHTRYPWSSSKGLLCEECLAIPPSLFTPGSTSVHWIYKGENAVGRIQASTGEGCPLCISIYDALKASQSPEEVTIGGNGIQLKGHWTPLNAETSRTQRYDFSAQTQNKHLLYTHTGPSFQSRNRFGPILTLSWGDSVSQLRFNIDQDPPPKKAAGIYTTSWDSYNDTKNFEQTRTHHYSMSAVTKPMSSLAPKADSPDIFQRLNSWLDECMEKHGSLCSYVGRRVIETDYSSPTRLINVGHDGVIPRLVNSATLRRDDGGFGPSYTALSHCWGNPELVPKTTTETLAQFMVAGLPLDELPPTFQHAIQITRKLNVEYLWIDSLCIVQDDPLDKSRELTTMDLIYSMAICTIVASGSADGLGGCFLPRGSDPDSHVRPYTIMVNKPKTKLSVTIQPYLADWGQALTSGPLFKRGWCFQERQLAKRVIHFTKAQILWECRTAFASEVYPEMKWHDSTEPERPFHMRWDRTTDTTMLANDPRRVEPWLKEWLHIVEAYSDKKLSVPNDRLPALAGVAAFFENKIRRPDPMHSRYFAGIWDGNMEMGLAWCPDFASRDPPRRNTVWPPPFKDPLTSKPISQSKATFLTSWLPCWSWICIDGPVRYYYSEGITDMPASIAGLTFDVRRPDAGLPMAYSPLDIVGGGVTFASPNKFKFGEISWGTLGLESFAVEVTVSEKSLITDSTTKASGPKCYSMFKKELKPFKFFKRPGPFASGVVFFDVDPHELPETKVYCLRLGTGRSLFDKTDGLVEFGIAMIEPTNLVSFNLRQHLDPLPMLRRVGLFEIDVWNKRWPKEAKRRSFYVI
ncbi:Fc.00g096780.m01.CDS01 [Cosmosporella sp. VM-42]